MRELWFSSLAWLSGVVGGARPHSALTPALTDVLPIFTNDEPHAVFTDPAPAQHSTAVSGKPLCARLVLQIYLYIIVIYPKKRGEM
jgi:hypothetical protein